MDEDPTEAGSEDEKRNADAINGSEADSDIDNDPVLRTRDDDEKKSLRILGSTRFRFGKSVGCDSST